MKIYSHNRGTFLKKYFFIPIILFIFALTNDDVQRRESSKASAFANKESGKYRCTGKARFFNYMRDSVEIFNEKQRFAKYLNKKHIPQPTNIAKENRKRKSHLRALNEATQRAQGLKNYATKAEVDMMGLLTNSNIPFVFQKIVIKGCTYRIVDFLINDNIVLEIDGKYHDQNKENDQKRTLWLKKQGVKQVIRFSNKQVFDYPARCLNHLKEAILLT